ncbi:MAG: AAA family ATPase [Lachnospiraceae bacterium]|nr:AAA family ATPase [Lachnospiraceae bacterium]MCD8248264.1 AAA family ATPase [Lachnospiraceae bacterium]
MPQTIAVAGKGGVGKTTLTGMLIQYLAEQKKGPILAVDADANSNLNEVLGVEVEMTLGDIRDELENSETAKESPIPKGMSKQDYTEFRFDSALVEEDDYDLLVMGHTQGKGCYCFVNGLLSTQVARRAQNYNYVIVDNEAGMEHISRGILPNVNIVILVSDSSRRGIQAVGRIARLIPECGLKPQKVGLIVNRAPKGVLTDGIQEEIEKQGLTLLGVVPQDDEVFEYDSEGTPTTELPAENPVKSALRKIVDQLQL